MKGAWIVLPALLAGCMSAPGTGEKTVNPRRERGSASASGAPEPSPSPAAEPKELPAAQAPEDPKLREAVEEYNRGARCEQEGKLNDAFEAYNASLNRYPRYAPAHVGIGNFYLMTGHIDDAEKAYLNALKSDPKCAKAHNNLAWLYVTTKTQLPRAADLCRKAIDLTQAQLNDARAAGNASEIERLRGELAECYSTQGWVYFHQAEHMAAVIAWDSAGKQLPEKETARRAVYLYRMALSLSLQGEPARALTAIVQARALKPAPELEAKLDALEASLAVK